MSRSEKNTSEDVILKAGQDLELLGPRTDFVWFSLEAPVFGGAAPAEQADSGANSANSARLPADMPLASKAALRADASKPAAALPPAALAPHREPRHEPHPVSADAPLPIPPISGDSNGSTGASAPGDNPDVIELPPVVPILPVDKLVLFPHMIAPLTLNTEEQKQMVDDALKAERLIGVFTRKEELGEGDSDTFENLHELGGACVVLRMLRVPDGSMRLLVHGVTRARIAEPVQIKPYLKARLSALKESKAEDGVELQALRKSALDQLQKIIQISSLSEELGVAANNIEEPGKLADLIASNIQLKTNELLEILGETDVRARLKKVLFYLSRELQVLELGSRIQSQVKTEIDRNQKQYVLREQMKAIRQELGEEDPQVKEMRELRERLKAKPMPNNVRKIAEKELERLDQMQPAAAEYGVIRTYIEWFFDLPWLESTPDNIDILHARDVLDEDHYGLDKVKERILEFLSVIRLRETMKGPILCFVGPPGVGKTSLGRSIARAMGRRFTRFSLGGMRDEAEIRGHRRTYIGAMPGRIIKSLKECKSNNPLIMLDEIDKLGTDFRGDPASALLEVLDPEQNYLFSDHYLDVPFNLSKVMFITTSNQLDPIPGPLKDRMEIIEISGYTAREKLAIAQEYLVPREMLANGLRKSELKFTPSALMAIIEDYTREAGVRNFQREIAAVCRKTARKIAEALGPPEPPPAVSASASSSASAASASSAAPLSASVREKAPSPDLESAQANSKKEKDALKREDAPEPVSPTPPNGQASAEPELDAYPEGFGRPKVTGGKARIAPIKIDPSKLREYLGPPKIFSEMAQRMGQPGVAIGMAWTPTGGDILFIEATRHAGSGKLTLTGKLGEVMKESAQAALTYLHSQAQHLGIAEEAFEKSDLHVHVPAGAVPKDGPSAGTAIFTALASLLTNHPVRDYLSMTGEITLRGQILPVGGIKEKCLAAQRAGVRTILLPKLNQDEFEEIPEEVRKQLEFHFVERVDEVLELALKPAKPSREAKRATKSTETLPRSKKSTKAPARKSPKGKTTANSPRKTNASRKKNKD